MKNRQTMFRPLISLSLSLDEKTKISSSSESDASVENSQLAIYNALDMEGKMKFMSTYNPKLWPKNAKPPITGNIFLRDVSKIGRQTDAECTRQLSLPSK